MPPTPPTARVVDPADVPHNGVATTDRPDREAGPASAIGMADRADVLRNEEALLDAFFSFADGRKTIVQDLPVVRFDAAGNELGRFILTVRPLDDRQIEKCETEATKFEVDKMTRARIPVKLDRPYLRERVIYEATVPEHRKLYWDNPKVHARLGAATALEAIDKTLFGGEKLRVFRAIETISGYTFLSDDEQVEAAKN